MPPADPQILVHGRHSLGQRLPQLTRFVDASATQLSISKHPAWLNVLQNAFGHEPYAVEAIHGGETVGFLPLAYLDTLVFGRFLVSLPYLNSNGPVASTPAVLQALASRAIELAEELNVRHLELRNETAIVHPALNAENTSKVHMRLDLPATSEQLWKALDPKVRNQVRKGEKHGFLISWGGVELLAPFHDVLSRNMRDLGSPVFGVELFREILAAFPDSAELCVMRDRARPVGAALLLHGRGVTEVPSASSLREYNPSCANMAMYWRLLVRAVERRQQVFDFGRSTADGNTFRFKKQWGAAPHPAVWQYHVIRGDVGDLRPDNPRYHRAIHLWQQLPLFVTRFVGPRIVRGIP
jgi:FemAB-related protein (PEP-CTERM system-associated)